MVNDFGVKASSPVGSCRIPAGLVFSRAFPDFRPGFTFAASRLGFYLCVDSYVLLYWFLSYLRDVEFLAESGVD